MNLDDFSHLSPGEMSASDSPSEEQPAIESSADECRYHIVAIGASAGGLEALEKFFAAASNDAGLAYIVVQHLSPDFKSQMDHLLARVTDMPVEVVRDGVAVKPNHVYLIPPRTDMEIRKGHLFLIERMDDKALSHPIDQFFRSLAGECGKKSVAVVLSGTGSDGTRGVTEIASHGGLVLAQEPTTARFDSMPANAMESGDVHLVMAPEAMPEAIVRYVAEGVTAESFGQTFGGEQLEPSAMSEVFRMLQRSHDIDFSNYKPTTVERRIRRRIELLKLHSLDQYVRRLVDSPGEVNELYKDLLIGVTRFFRDTEAYEHLAQSAIPQLLDQMEGDTLRVWVCGCATGEEAYSLAMIIAEAIDASGKDITLKMFATDAHKESLQIAATGLYTEAAMAGVSEQRRERFFQKRKDRFYVSGELRRKIVFAPHNIIKDPPFTQMQLITCRNLLIYLQPEVQQKILSIFHFALRQNGVLWLGPSESPGELGEEFEALQRHWKIYRKRRDVTLPVEFRLPTADRSSGREVATDFMMNRKGRTNSDLLPAIYDTLLGLKMPPSVLIDGQLQLFHAFAGCEEYLRYPSGRPTLHILEIIYPPIKNSLAAAVQHSIREGKSVRYTGMPHPTDKEQLLDLLVEPVKVPGTNAPFYLIQFEPREIADASAESEYQHIDVGAVASERIDSLEQDLSYTRQNLQATIEELETSNEELQAANEEMVAANEELQSTNEELHSVNEELYTVNAEHQKRVRELDDANADMVNLLAATRVGVIFLDEHLVIRRFTPEAGQILQLGSTAVGNSLKDEIEQITNPDAFMEGVTAALDDHNEVEWEIELSNLKYFARCQPYWAGKTIAGVVLSLMNIDSLRSAESAAQRFRFMADQNTDAQLLADGSGELIYANQSLADKLGYTIDQLLGMKLWEIEPNQTRQNYSERLQLIAGSEDNIIESEYLKANGQSLPVEIALTQVEWDHQPFLFATVRDISARLQAEEHRRMLEKAIESVASGIFICEANSPHHRVMFVNPSFTQITGYQPADVIHKDCCTFLHTEESDPNALEQLQTSMEKGKHCLVQFQSSRKDGTGYWCELEVTPVADKTGRNTHVVGILNDVTTTIEAEIELRDNERMIRSLLNSTGEGIFGLDLNGECTFCNSAALRLLGYDSDTELVGKNIHQHIHNRRSDGTVFSSDECQLCEASQSGQALNCDEEVFVRKDGAIIPVEYWCHPLFDNGQCTGAVVAFVDTTLRREEREELRRAHDAADSANKAKSQFLANMSHELRTPLAAILGYSRILKEELSDTSDIEKLQTIERNGEYVLKLVGDILDLSRIEAGKLSLTNDVFRLDEFLSELSVTMSVRAEEYGADLNFSLDNPLPEKINTDPARLRQILINLIGNGLKFSRGGLVEVRVGMLDAPDQERRLRFDVRDNGIGISESQLETLFAPFTQANSTIATRFGGTGLGLSITKRLLESMGGSISAESEEGKGSCFTVIIPVNTSSGLADLALQQQTPEKEEDLNVDLKELNARILIADDRRDIQFIGKHFLTKAGCQVACAENGQEAVDMVLESYESGDAFDLILMDVQMPVLDGIQAVRQLRERNIEIPVIAATADAMKGTRRMLISKGFDDYLTKPFNVNSLLGMVKRMLDR